MYIFQDLIKKKQITLKLQTLVAYSNHYEILDIQVVYIMEVGVAAQI